MLSTCAHSFQCTCNETQLKIQNHDDDSGVEGDQVQDEEFYEEDEEEVVEKENEDEDKEEQDGEEDEDNEEEN